MRLIQLFTDKEKRERLDKLRPLPHGLLYSTKHGIVCLKRNGKLLELARGEYTTCIQRLEAMAGEEIDNFISDSMHNPRISEAFKIAACNHNG